MTEFWGDKARATERERILHLSAARDLKLHAATHGARLLISEPELDLDGYDFAMWSEFEAVYIQSKSTLKHGGARSWYVRAALLKPSFYNRDLIPALDGVNTWGMEVGGDGGVLLHVIDQKASTMQNLVVEYRYLDIFWLIGVTAGAIKKSEKARLRALNLIREIRDAGSNDRIKLNLGDFARLPCVEAIAALRLHIGASSNWATVGQLVSELSAPPSLAHFEPIWTGIEGVS